MSSSPSSEEQPKRKSSVLLFSILVVVLLAAAGLWWWQRHDPYVNDRADVRESKALMDTSRKRPLTDQEFDRAIEFLEPNYHPISQMFVLGIIGLEVERAPDRRERAIAQLQKCQQNTDPMVAEVASMTSSRLQSASK